MSQLIDQLKKEHAVILGVMAKVRELGVGSQEGKATLLAAKSGLLAHLRKEDTDLYPKMKKAAETNPELKRTLEMFAEDMDSISKEALRFFDKYTNGGSDIEFAKDFGSLTATLGARVRREENILYAAFEKLG